MNAVDATPITMDGATNATAATAGVRNRGETSPSVLGQSPPLAPAKITRDVCVFAATKELVTLDRNTQVMSGATNGMNAFAAVWNGLAVGGERARVAGAERDHDRVGAEHVDHAADQDGADHRDRHVPARVVRLLGQRRRCLEAAEGEHRQAEREQHVAAARPAT